VRWGAASPFAWRSPALLGRWHISGQKLVCALFPGFAGPWIFFLLPQPRRSPLLLSASALLCFLDQIFGRCSECDLTVAQRRGPLWWAVKLRPLLRTRTELGPSAQIYWCDCTHAPGVSCLPRNSVWKSSQEWFWAGSEFLRVEEQPVWGGASALLLGRVSLVGGLCCSFLLHLPAMSTRLCKPPKELSASRRTQQIHIRPYTLDFHSGSCVLRPF